MFVIKIINNKINFVNNVESNVNVKSNLFLGILMNSNVRILFSMKLINSIFILIKFPLKMEGIKFIYSWKHFFILHRDSNLPKNILFKPPIVIQIYIKFFGYKKIQTKIQKLIWIKLLIIRQFFNFIHLSVYYQVNFLFNYSHIFNQKVYGKIFSWWKMLTLDHLIRK